MTRGLVIDTVAIGKMAGRMMLQIAVCYIFHVQVTVLPAPPVAPLTLTGVSYF